MTSTDVSTRRLGESGTGLRVLVAGIGNIFFGDDAFGVEVVHRLLHRPHPEGVEVVDVGIRGLHLAHQLLDGYDVLVMVDALPAGEVPGTVTLLEIEPAAPPAERTGPPTPTDPAFDGHTIDPNVVLATLAHLGGSVGRVLVVGCEPETCAPAMGLSDAVEGSIESAITLVERVVAELLPTTERLEIAR